MKNLVFLVDLNVSITPFFLIKIQRRGNAIILLKKLLEDFSKDDQFQFFGYINEERCYLNLRGNQLLQLKLFNTCYRQLIYGISHRLTSYL